MPKNYYNKNYSNRKFHLLPKILKNLNEWKEPFHIPKFRPIVSDVNSITCNYSKAILPFLQKIETSFDSVCLNSLEIVHFLNKQYNCESTSTHKQILLITADVENLFTNINLTQLYDILKHYEIPISGREFSLETFKLLLFNNTFSCYNKNFLQIKGLPMGGPLSGSLANIYLGHLEKNIINKFSNNIVLYKRYMDDIIILFKGNLNTLKKLIENLKSSFLINITYSISHFSTNYLDLNIFKNSLGTFTITPFYKNKNPIINLPLKIDKRPFKLFSSLTCTQLLRIWRISNNILLFNQTLHNLLLQVEERKKIKNIIRTFFEPVKCDTNIIKNLYHINNYELPIYNIEHNVCSSCSSISAKKHSQITKSIVIGNQTLFSMEPVDCATGDLLILLVHFNFLYAKLIGPTTIKRAITYCPPYSTLFIIAKHKSRRLKRILEKIKKIDIVIDVSMPKQSQDPLPCFVHQICQKPNMDYGLQVQLKKRKTFYTLLKKTIE